jgi:hypothetical protein
MRLFILGVTVIMLFPFSTSCRMTRLTGNFVSTIDASGSFVPLGGSVVRCIDSKGKRQCFPAKTLRDDDE